MDLDIQVSKLKLLKANHTSQIYRLEDNITKNYPKQIKNLEERIEGLKADIALYQARKPADKDVFSMTVGGVTYDERKEAGAALIAACKDMKQANKAVPVGEYLGMQMSVTFDSFDRKEDFLFDSLACLIIRRLIISSVDKLSTCEHSVKDGLVRLKFASG